MSGFIEWLESQNKRDTKVRAVLRRSLAFDPGTFVPAYPYVEPFVRDESNSWRREMHYLVAGLWAAHWREGRRGEPMAIGKACHALYVANNMSPSIERRFINALDSDRDQLSNRLRQIVGLLKDYPLDFGSLLAGLLRWNDDRKFTQNAWAGDFYRNIKDEMETKPLVLEEQSA